MVDPAGDSGAAKKASHVQLRTCDSERTTSTYKSGRGLAQRGNVRTITLASSLLLIMKGASSIVRCIHAAR